MKQCHKPWLHFLSRSFRTNWCSRRCKRRSSVRRLPCIEPNNFALAQSSQQQSAVEVAKDMGEAKDKGPASWVRRSCSAGEGSPPAIRERRIEIHKWEIGASWWYPLWTTEKSDIRAWSTERGSWTYWSHRTTVLPSSTPSPPQFCLPKLS